jgi:DNA-directed RNA polymerase alpha subunit
MSRNFNISNNERKWFKRLLKETTLLETSNISAKDRFLFEQYLNGAFDIKMIIETKLSKDGLDASLLKSLVKITRRINELENKENYLNELITNNKEKENRLIQNDLNLNVETKINQVAEVEKLNLSIRAKNALLQLNINEVKELSQLTIEKILSVPNLGKKTLTEIIDVANDYGIELK